MLHRNLQAAAIVCSAIDASDVIPTKNVNARKGCRIPNTYMMVWSIRATRNTWK